MRNRSAILLALLIIGAGIFTAAVPAGDAGASVQATARTVVEPDPLPPFPKFDALLYLGDFSDIYTADSVDQSTVLINGRPARGISLLSSHADFTGAVVQIDAWILDVTSGEYMDGSDPSVSFTITGAMLDGTEFSADGTADLYLVSALDVDDNGTVDATDLQLLADYMFQQLPSLPADGRGDANLDGFVDSTDLGLIVRYLFTP